MLIRPAVIVSWPKHIDYPLFRHNLRRFHRYFQDVFVCLTESNMPLNLSNFIQQKLEGYATFIKPNFKEVDWRNDSIRAMLTLDTAATHYLFLEQDFLIKDNSFWEKILSSGKDFVYYDEHGRVHPAFALINRGLVYQTDMNFSADPDHGFDHFGHFFEEIQKLDHGTEIRELGVIEKKDFYHLAGLTQNYWNFKCGTPFYKPEEFLPYNYESMLMPEQEQQFYKEQMAILTEKGFYHRDSFIIDFFPDLKG